MTIASEYLMGHKISGKSRKHYAIPNLYDIAEELKRIEKKMQENDTKRIQNESKG